MTTATPDMTSTTEHSPLAEALNFTEADLAANRDGKISERQRGFIIVDRQKNILLGAAIVGALVFAVTGLLYLGNANSNGILQVLGIVLLVITTSLSWFFAFNWRRMTYDLRTNDVEMIEGEAQHVMRQVGRAQAGSIRIGDTVEVPADSLDTFRAFAPGATYRLYRTAYTGRLLSAEPLDR
ncbi:MAG: hypothetical protein AAF125_15835 [Chloroflexota bacterium]